MTARWRTALVVLAAILAGVVRAEPTLRYNYDYACNQERLSSGTVETTATRRTCRPRRRKTTFASLLPGPPQDRRHRSHGHRAAWRPDQESRGLWSVWRSPSSGSQADERSAAAAAPVLHRRRPGAGCCRPRSRRPSSRRVRRLIGGTSSSATICIFVLPANLKPGGPRDVAGS